MPMPTNASNLWSGTRSPTSTRVDSVSRLGEVTLDADKHGTEPPFQTAQFTRARDWLARHGESVLNEQIELARVPAPPFHERERSETIAAKLGLLG